MSSDYIQYVNIFDINEIIVIEEQSYRKPWTRDHFESDVENNSSLNYKFKKNNELRGYLFGHLIGSEYHLNKITVKRKHRQRNIGNLLFFHCLKELVDKNVRCVQLEVSSLNLIAQKFYKSLSFVEVGIRKKYYSDCEDALLYNFTSIKNYPASSKKNNNKSSCNGKSNFG